MTNRDKKTTDDNRAQWLSNPLEAFDDHPYSLSESDLPRLLGYGNKGSFNKYGD